MSFLYMDIFPDDGKDMAMTLGVTYVRSKSKPSCW